MDLTLKHKMYNMIFAKKTLFCSNNTLDKQSNFTENNSVDSSKDFTDDTIHKENYMTKTQLLEFEKQLKTMKKDTLKKVYEILDDLKQGGFKLSDIRNLTPTEDNIVLKCKAYNSSRNTLYEIDNALDKIKTGQYGYCEETGEMIDLARLRLIPTARLSVEAQEENDMMNKKFHG